MWARPVISRMIFSRPRKGCARKSSNILIISARGQMDVRLAKFCVAVSKATVILAGIGAAGRIILARGMHPCGVSEVFAQLFLKSAYSLPSVEVAER